MLSKKKFGTKYALSATIITTLYLYSFAYAGHERGNGLDFNVLSEHTVWFSGTEAVPYCIEIENDLEISEGFVREQFINALRTWQNYASERVANPHIQINFNLVELLSGCDGSENLRIVFGSAPAELQLTFDPLRLEGMVAVAYPLPATFGHRNRTGVLWVNSQFEEMWQYPFRMHGLFLHELGHIYGNGHVAGTVMSELFLVQLFEENLDLDVAKTLNLNIDHQSELVICKSCSYQLEGTLDFRRGFTDQDIFDRNVNQRFERLFGHAPDGQVHAILQIDRNPFSTPSASLVVGDNTNAYDVELEMYWQAFTIATSPESSRFKYYTHTDDDEIVFSFEPYTAITTPGVARLPDGRQLQVQLEHNLGEAPLMLSFLEDVSIGTRVEKVRSILFGPDNKWEIDWANLHQD